MFLSTTETTVLVEAKAEEAKQTSQQYIALHYK